MDGYFYIIATLRDDKAILAYRLLSLDGSGIVDIKKECIQKLDSNILCARYDSVYKCMVSETDISIESLPILGTNKLLKTEGGIAITSEVLDKSGSIIGYTVYDSLGTTTSVSIDTIKMLARRSRCINFKIESGYGRDIVKPLEGGIFSRKVLDTYKRTSYRDGDSINRSEVINPESIPKVPVYSLSTVKSTSFNKTANEAMFDAIVGLKKMCPYYYVLLQTIDKRPCTDEVCETFCVTEDKMYYNVGFMVSLTPAEIRFVLIHEIMHIAMMHSARKGNRDAYLWNVATDLYINEMMLHDFDLVPGVEKEVNGVGICAITSGLYFSRIGEVCNLSKDLPELIYKRLSKESNSGGSSTQSDRQNNSSDSQSSQSEGGQSQDGDYTVKYNGKELEGDCIDTIMSNTGRDTDDKKEQSDEQAKQKLSDMNTKKRMVEEKIGKDLTKGMSGADLLQRIINYNLNVTVDWRAILKNIILEKPRRKYTLASPNEAYMNMGVTLASRQRIGKPEKIKNIKICIDISGSVSDTEISRFLSEVAGIFDAYDADAELVYWNTSVCDAGLVSGRKDLSRVNSNWSGGTNVKCLFDWLAGKTESVTGKRVTGKPRDIRAVIIITDGYFDKNYEEYESAFGNKTLWLIDGYGATFDSCFGRVASLTNGDIK